MQHLKVGNFSKPGRTERERMEIGATDSRLPDSGSRRGIRLWHTYFAVIESREVVSTFLPE